MIAVSSLLTTGMTEPWQLFLLWGVVNGLATGAVSVPLAAIIANRWFVERRGLVTGVLTASNASGQLVFLPLLAWVASMDWRYAALLVAVAALGFVLPLVLLFMRDRPRDVGARPFGAPPDWEEPPAAPAGPRRRPERAPAPAPARARSGFSPGRSSCAVRPPTASSRRT